MKQKITAVVCALSLIVTGITVGTNSYVAKGDTGVVVSFEYDGTDAVAGEDLPYATEDDSYTYVATTGTGTLQASTTGTNLKHLEWGDPLDYGKAIPILPAGSSNPWSEDAYLAFSFSTTDYTNMSGSIQVGGTKKGPANLQIGYYNSEDTFVQLTTYTIAKNKTMYTVEFTLPTALENQSSVTIYVKLVNTTNIGGNEMTSAAYNTGGELAFNNFIVNGEKEAVVTTEETTTEAAQVETTTVEEQIETTTEPEQVETTTVEEQIETTTEPEQIETTAENAGDSVTTRIVEPTKDSSKVSPDVKKVVVKSTKIVKAKRSKNNKKISLKLKKVSGATGYKIKYSVNSNMKKSVTKTVKKTKVTLKKLNKKKKYYIQVCAYIKKSGNVYQSAWSTKKSVKRK